MAGERQVWTKARTFLGSLLRDVRANTIAVMAIALIPLAGMVGGGIDISRMYIVKTRLQHACDAGALAGRKMMGGGIWSQSNYAPRTEAVRFFEANYNPAAYGATSVTKSFTESAGKVTGTAEATVPMTLMRIFGRTTETLNVSCDAEMRLPNTDVMFVLDVTGSMGDKAVSTDSQTKIQGLRSAVKCFYETVSRLNTTESCVGGDPSGGVGDQVQVRFGFMPYSSNVNVGKLLPTSYFADTWKYQSREPQYTTVSSTTWTDGAVTQTGTDWDRDWSGNWVELQSTTASQSACQNMSNQLRYTSGGESGRKNQNTTGTNPRVTTWYTDQDAWWYEFSFRDWRSWDGRCRYYRREASGDMERLYSQTSTGVTVNTQVFNNYKYFQRTVDVSGLKNGASWNNSFEVNVGTAGANKTITWDGCIEERPTTRTTNFSTIPTAAYDLNIDLVPTSGNANSLWGPVLPDLVYLRQLNTSWWGLTGTYNTADVTTGSDYMDGNSVTYCPAEARKLQEWNTASTFESYVDGLQPTGNTYHDIGLLWGARFMSPTGIFKADNEFTSQGGEIERHMIFMTDGEACTGITNYTAYGVAWWDRRQTAANTAPTDGCLTTGTLTEQVNLRTAALCREVKNKNITLWVIWFGASNTTIEDMLEACATNSRFFTARNSTELQTTFRSIADQISQLRLTR